MLLSIDRILQLLAEGKSVEKIAEMSDVTCADVCDMIEDARKLLLDYDKSRMKKRLIGRKKEKRNTNNSIGKGTVDINTEELLSGAELSAVPVDSELVMYTDGASSGNPGPAGIGIVINDSEGRQVGKVSSYIGEKTNNYAEYYALIRALKFGIYFKVRQLKVRTDSELIVKQIKGEYKVSHENIKPLYEEAKKLLEMIPSYKVEHVTRNLNDKADYLAKKAISSYKKKRG